MQYHTILLTHDGSALADAAIPHAAALAQAPAARLLALRVVERVGTVIAHISPPAEWTGSSSGMGEAAEEIVAKDVHRR